MNQRGEALTQQKTLRDWQDQAERLAPPTRAWIGGDRADAASGETFKDISPGDGRGIANVASCDAEDVDRAVRSAREAFDRGVWSRMAPARRKKRLLRLAELMRGRLEELALLETLDVGKPISDALGVDVLAAANCFQWYAEAIDKRYGEIAPTPDSALALVSREPLGVVGAVVPWNYPLILTAWKVAPALATGNSVVLKPAEQSPLSALVLGELASEAGIPDGVLNVVPGFGETAGAALGRHMEVDKISFTGSAEVGKLFLRYAGESNMKRVSLECGGKSPQLVLADADNLDKAAESIAWGIFYNAGQTCHAGSRLVVERKVKDELLERISAFARDLAPGDPLDPATSLGSVVDATQLDRVLGYVELGKEEGASVAFGGNRAREESGGYYVEPTVLEGVRSEMRVAQEEIFGPVLSVLEFSEPEEGLKIANSTDYGLAASVWTRDVTKAHRVSKALRAGTVWVNTYDAADIVTPFGGFGQSGLSSDRSLHALDEYTQLKTTWLDLNT
jgi:acyl-CoA reductase-like NAD-dependent aldehyde dehydrogenase